MGKKLYTILTFAILFISLSSHLLHASPIHKINKEDKHLEENKRPSFLQKEMKGFRVLQEEPQPNLENAAPTNPEAKKGDDDEDDDFVNHDDAKDKNADEDDYANDPKDEDVDMNGRNSPNPDQKDNDASDLDHDDLNDQKGDQSGADDDASKDGENDDEDEDEDDDEDEDVSDAKDPEDTENAESNKKGAAEELAQKPQMTDQDSVNFHDINNVYLIAILVVLILLCIGCMGKMIYDFSRRVEAQYDHKELEEDDDFDEIEMSSNTKNSRKIETDDSRAEEEKESPMHSGANKKKRNLDY